MHKDRFERCRISFPAICTRCGMSGPLRTTQLTLPYRAWWRSNPVIKVPVCTMCAVSLGIEAWASLLLMLGASSAITFYLPRWGILLLIHTQQRIFRSVSDWVYSQLFVEVVVCSVLLMAMSLFGNLRDRFLRRNHMKLRVTDYGNDWVELSSSDDLYFGELAKQSLLYTE